MPRTRRICYCPQHQGPRSYAVKTWFKHRIACRRNGTDFEYWKRDANLHELAIGGPSPEPVPPEPIPDTQVHAGPAQNNATAIRARLQLQRERGRHTPRRLIAVPQSQGEDSDSSRESDIGNQAPAHNASGAHPWTRPRRASPLLQTRPNAENMDLDDTDPEQDSESPYESTTDEEQEGEIEEPPASGNPPSDPDSDPDEDDEEDELLPDLLREFFETISVEDLLHGAGACYDPIASSPHGSASGCPLRSAVSSSSSHKHTNEQ